MAGHRSAGLSWFGFNAFPKSRGRLATSLQGLACAWKVTWCTYCLAPAAGVIQAQPYSHNIYYSAWIFKKLMRSAPRSECDAASTFLFPWCNRILARLAAHRMQIPPPPPPRRRAAVARFLLRSCLSSVCLSFPPQHAAFPYFDRWFMVYWVQPSSQPRRERSLAHCETSERVENIINKKGDDFQALFVKKIWSQIDQSVPELGSWV